MKSILLTGAYGFVGNTLKEVLSPQSDLTTLGLNKKNQIVCDLSKDIPVISKNIDILIHTAGKAHTVPKNEEDALEFHKINYQGTLNLLEGISNSGYPISQIIYFSTVAVYGKDGGLDIKEDWPLNGITPYAKSKIMAEKAVINWCEQNDVKYIILRLPLIAGENAPGNLGAIKNAIAKGRYFRIAGNHAKKSVVLAEDIAAFIPNLDGMQGIFNLTDGVNPSFYQIEESIAKKVGNPIRLTLPLALAKVMAIFGDILNTFKISFPINSDKLVKLTSSLTFDDKAAREILGWKSKSAF